MRNHCIALHGAKGGGMIGISTKLYSDMYRATKQ